MLERASSASARTPAREETLIAFDFGTKHVGVAVGNTVTATARPLQTLSAQGTVLWAQIDALVAQWQPQRFVVGIAYHPDGAAHEMTARCLRFARQLQGRYPIAVEQVDERYSTTAADPKAGGAVDARAAAIILQQWLDGVTRNERIQND